MGIVMHQNSSGAWGDLETPFLNGINYRRMTKIGYFIHIAIC